MKRGLLLPLSMSAVLWAHPMGNFSVSHYSRIEMSAQGAKIRYILDLAEIPTFQLLQQWKVWSEPIPLHFRPRRRRASLLHSLLQTRYKSKKRQGEFENS